MLGVEIPPIDFGQVLGEILPWIMLVILLIVLAGGCYKLVKGIFK